MARPIDLLRPPTLTAKLRLVAAVGALSMALVAVTLLAIARAQVEMVCDRETGAS